MVNAAVACGQQPVRMGGSLINVALARQRREELGYSLKQLALKMQVAPSELSRWENNVRVPRVERLAVWERALGLEAGTLMREGGTGTAS